MGHRIRLPDFSSDVENESSVVGDDVTEALDALSTKITGLGTDDIGNDSGVAGADASAALDQLDTDIGALGSDDIGDDSNYATTNVTKALNQVLLETGGIVRTKSATAPVAPSDGDEWYHTTQRVTYTYDSSRSKWLGQLEWWDCGRNTNLTGAITDRMYTAGNLLTDRTDSTLARGFLLPYDVTVVGVSIKQRTSASGGTGTIVLYETTRGGGYAANTTVTPGTTTEYTDLTLNNDSPSGDSWSCYSILGAGETIQYPFCRWQFRRHGT